MNIRRISATGLLAFASISASAGDDLSGWGFGIGIGFENYQSPYVKTASINGTDKIVTVDEEYKSTPALWSAVNWTVTDCENSHGPAKWVCTDWVKPGWFVGAKLVGESGVGLDGAAVGIQWAFLRSEQVLQLDGTTKSEQRKSLNIGIGVAVAKFRELAQGINEGDPLPSYYDDIKYRDTTDSALLIMISKDISM